MDFEAMIRAELAKGRKMEDIAKQVGASMNKIQDEENTKANSRNSKVAEIEKLFWDHIKSQKLELEDVAYLALLVVQDRYPEWTKDNIEGFVNSVQTNVDMLAKIQTKSTNEIVNEVMGEIFSPINKRMETDREKIRKFLDNI